MTDHYASADVTIDTDGAFEVLEQLFYREELDICFRITCRDSTEQYKQVQLTLYVDDKETTTCITLDSRGAVWGMQQFIEPLRDYIKPK